MLGNHVDIQLVGEYNILVRIVVQVLFINQVIAAYYYPRLARMFATKIEFQKIAKYNTKFVLLSVTSVILLSFVVIITLLYFNVSNIRVDKDMLSVAAIFIATNLVYSALSFYSYILVYIKKQKIEYFNNVVILFIGISLNLILIPMYGVVGAALASAIAIVLGNLLEMVQVKHYSKTYFFDLKSIKA
jgi:O-antigen/teichoic acid export membrane protein